MKYDYLIIGGGIVGLSSAYHILKEKPGARLIVLEKENELAAHQTGHNSGVIHSGIYYKPGSLKATNCINGYNMLLDFCNQHEVKYELCGKLIVATNSTEIPELEKLYERGLQNGLSKISYVEKQDIAAHEPHLNGVKAIHVPYTGIIDYTSVCDALAQQIKLMGGEIGLGKKVIDIKKALGQTEVVTDNETYLTQMLVNCAGL